MLKKENVLPSLKGNFLSELYKKGLIHGAEIHNDDLEKKFKKRLYRIWHNLVKKFVFKIGIPAYSDSDAHEKERIGNSLSYVYI